jgi:CelD/BcsL family acetyltransferase involved in cellulose biosynthesis
MRHYRRRLVLALRRGLSFLGRPAGVTATQKRSRRERQSNSLPGELNIEVVSTIEGIRALAPDYERLYRASDNRLPFARQEWHLAWCQHFLNRNPRIRDEPLFCVVRNRTGECVALVPLILSRRRVGPLRFGTVDLIGGDPNLTEIRNPLIEPGFERAAVAAVHESLSDTPGWDWVVWNHISDELADALEQEAAPEWHKPAQDFMLDLPRSWSEFRTGLKRNIRESLRHCYNSLKRDQLSFEFDVARTRTEVRGALRRFLELHALRADWPHGPKHPNWFHGRPLQDFLYDVCDRLAQHDCVRIFQLRIKGEVVASRVAFVVGDCLYLYYSGFDPQYARYSVMTTTVAEAFRYAIDHGIRTVNLSLTAEQSKLRWGPRLVLLHSAFVHREALLSRIACRAYQVAVTGNGMPARLLKSVFTARRRWN